MVSTDEILAMVIAAEAGGGCLPETALTLMKEGTIIPSDRTIRIAHLVDKKISEVKEQERLRYNEVLVDAINKVSAACNAEMTLTVQNIKSDLQNLTEITSQERILDNIENINSLILDTKDIVLKQNDSESYKNGVNQFYEYIVERLENLRFVKKSYLISLKAKRFTEKGS